MEERLKNWLNNLYLIMISLPAIPVIFDINNRYWQAYIAVGLLILIQCFQYISDIDLEKPDARQMLLHRICGLGKLALLSWYIFLTGYWLFCPLYYIIISSGNIKDKKLAFLLPILGLFGVWLNRLINIEGIIKFIFAYGYGAGGSAQSESNKDRTANKQTILRIFAFRIDRMS